jgi:hypothetical protein
MFLGRAVENAIAENEKKPKNQRKPVRAVINQMLGLTANTYSPLASKATTKTAKLLPGETPFEAVMRVAEGNGKGNQKSQPG